MLKIEFCSNSSGKSGRTTGMDKTEAVAIIDNGHDS
jgi:hypothetical protein